MALTARATEPVTWGEQIVPVLRKRLEHESRALTKRMSQPGPPDDVRPAVNRTTSEQERPSHIPRPSMQSLVSDETPRRMRPRTHSTPRPFDRDMLTPASSRSASPAVTTTPRPSRIPTRPRAGSRPIPTEFPPSPDPSPDLWPLSENIIRTQLTPPTPDRPAHRRKRDTFVPPPPDDNDEILFDEPAPFTINANSLAGRSSIDEYEHWYRGEGRGGGGRNGGRGEIRIATRTEMLEIASFGHPPSRNNSHAHAYGEFGWRNKAYDDSTIGTRFKWPDGDPENSVLDEAPLTDLDDMDTESYNPGSQEARSIEVRSIESHAQDAFSEGHTLEEVRSIELEPEPDGRPEPMTPVKPPPSRIARAVSPPVGPGTSTTSLVSRTGRSPTPSKALSTASKAQSPPRKAQSPPPKSIQSPKAKSPGRRGTNASTTPKSPSSRAGTSQLSPKPGSTPKTPRIGAAASPARHNTSPSPRTRAQSTSTKSTGTKRTKKLSTADSAGPHSLADAIPQIPPAQQIPDDGNWDDVVLPTIARKLQGVDVVMLERKPVEEVEEPLPPAPGTFGYQERQREKERKARDQRRDSGTELEEFGAWDGMARKPKTVEKAEERKKADERAKAPSPPPFSDYTPIPPVVKPPEPIPKPVVQPMVISEGDLRQGMSRKDESHDSGCCKCVVM